MGEGPTSKWAMSTAKRLNCKVCVGYPEIQKGVSSKQQASASVDAQSTDKCFNSLLVVDCDGTILLNYRKRFLYYTDEAWAAEGDAGWGFHTFLFPARENSMKDIGSTTHGALDSGMRHVSTSFGICMDINPYRFEAPFTAWEFANRVIDSRSQLVVLSMAWLTALELEDFASLGSQPDMKTLNYWIQRFWPLFKRQMIHDNDSGDQFPRSEKKIVIVFANRSGVEEGTGGNQTARYSGTSSIVAITQKPQETESRTTTTSNTIAREDGRSSQGDDKNDFRDFEAKILCWDMKGTMEEGICFADTLSRPDMVFHMVEKSDESQRPR
jgi:protein N-terminal amidase